MIIFIVPKTFYVDIGGTPAIVLFENLLETAEINGIDKNNLVAILDPFDLSRAERKLELGDYKPKALKFSLNDDEIDVNRAADYTKAPAESDCIKLLEEAKCKVLGKIQSNYGKRINLIEIESRYNLLKEEVVSLSRNSVSLREFMNGLIEVFSPGLKKIKLEDVLASNTALIYTLLQSFEIPIRAICPSCKRFVSSFLGQNTPCCSSPSDKIIKSGRYIPQSGFLPAITYLCGYRTYSNSEEKMQQTNEILSKLGLENKAILNYPELNKGRTMVESFILRNLK